MPYKDDEKRRRATRLRVKRYRDRQKQQLNVTPGRRVGNGVTNDTEVPAWYRLMRLYI
jgi:hypothetical protein